MKNYLPRTFLILVVVSISLLFSCGKKDKKDSKDDGATTPQGDPTGNENNNENNNDDSNNNDDNNNQADDNNDSTDGGFAVTGTLILSSSRINLRLAGEADYAYAVNTAASFGSEWRKKAALGADGSFTLDLSKGDPWVIVFIDSTQTGANMIKAKFKASEIDSVAPKYTESQDSTSLGTLEVDETAKTASLNSSKYDEFIGTLGLSSTEADTLGVLDDLMLRYINPDINGNGVLDMDEPTMPQTSIIIWHGFRFTNGDDVLAKIKAGEEIPVDEPITFRGADPELRVGETASGVFSAMPEKISLEWTDSGNYDGGTLATYLKSGGGSSNVVTFDDLNGGTGNIGFKVMFESTVTRVPSGTYTYKFYAVEDDEAPGETFTYTNVQTSTDASSLLYSVFPFPIFTVDEAGDIISLNYTWKKYDGTTFVEATKGDIELIMGKSSAEIKWYTGSERDSSIFCNWAPYQNDFATTGTIDTTTCSAGGDYSKKLSEVSNVGISFTTKNGLWMKLSAQASY